MLDKVKKFLNENKWIVITFLLSSIVISVIYTLQKIAPFGKNSMLDVDFYHQYGPLLNELYDRVKSGEGLLYSFNTGGGIPFYRNFLNYLSSPFNIILFFFKKDNIVMAFSIVIALKAIFASITMAYFLKKFFKNNNFLIVVFSMLYVFSGYFCAYYWNIMWLDGMVFLPLIAYGISKIIDDKKPLLYIISLAVMLFANYFIAYMICIFSVFYFIGYFWYKHGFKLREFIKTGFCFFISSLLAAGLVSFALIPLYYSLSSISATTGSFPSTEISFNVFAFLFNHLTGVKRTVFSSDILPLPNVYPGLISIVLFITIFINRKINWKVKIIAILFLTLFLSSFAVTSIDFIWHAFHVPNDLPWRYSFIYVFGFVSLSYYAALKVKQLNAIKVSIVFGLMIIFPLLALKFNFENADITVALTCILLLLLYYLLYISGKNKNIPRGILKFCLLILTSFECVYGINANWHIDHDIDNFMENKSPYKKLVDIARKDDNGLYRIEKTNYLTLNDGAWYDYYGMSTFSSMAYESVSKSQRKLGMAGNDINSYYYQYIQTPIYNTMFNVKYLMGNLIENDYYTPIESKDTYNLLLYNYNSSLVYSVNKEIKKWKLLDFKPFLNQEEFVNLSTGVKNVYEPLIVKEVLQGKINEVSFSNHSYGEYNYELDKPSKELELIINNPKVENVYFYIGGNKVSSFKINDDYYSLTSDEYYTLDAGKLPEGNISVKITFEDLDDGSLKFYAYTINDEAFKKFYELLSDGFLEVEKYNETYIEGNMSAKNNQIAFSTIAYDEGWRVLVDDKKVNTYKVLDSYLAFDINEGKHNVKLIYYPKGMKNGIIISVISLVITNFYVLYFNRSKRKNEKSV